MKTGLESSERRFSVLSGGSGGILICRKARERVAVQETGRLRSVKQKKKCHFHRKA